MTSTTRRAALTALASASASVSALALPAAAMTEPVDPIFAAIERHRKAHAAFSEVCGLEDEVAAEQQGRQVTEADQATVKAANDAEEAALDELFDTPAQTLAGLRAVIEHIVKHDYGCVPDVSGAFLETLLQSPVLNA